MDSKINIWIDRAIKNRIKILTYGKKGGMSRWIREVVLLALVRAEKRRDKK